MKRLWFGALLGVVIVSSATGAVFAAQSHSADYQVNEVQFGSGSLLKAASSNYQAQQSLGATAGGFTKSASYWSQAGYLTPNQPFLEMVVNPANINLGTLSSNSTSTGTATFHVRAYTDSGYTVMSMNDPPSQEDGKYLSAMSTPGQSQVGKEQFGINLAQNLTTCTNPAPANFGANPNPVPGANFADGVAASGYNTCGLFKYNKGDVIGESTSNGWGETDFTISYIVNVSTVTKAGSYKMTQDLVAVATY